VGSSSQLSLIPIGCRERGFLPVRAEIQITAGEARSEFAVLAPFSPGRLGPEGAPGGDDCFTTFERYETQIAIES
jgi:hypothetical protein